MARSGLGGEETGVAQAKKIRDQRHRIHDGKDLAFRRQGEEDYRPSRPRVLQGVCVRRLVEFHFSLLFFFLSKLLDLGSIPDCKLSGQSIILS